MMHQGNTAADHESVDYEAPPSSGPIPSRLPRSEGGADLWSYDRIHHAEARVYRPACDADLRALLRTLSRRPEKRRITFRGGGQSIDGHALNDDVIILLDTVEMRRIGAPQRDEQGYFITLGGAATWGEILEKLSDDGLVPYSVVTTSHATVGGTVAADCLSRCSPISGREGRHVRSFKLLTIDGTLIECLRDDPDPERRALYHAAIGGFGYLGVITEVTLDVRPPLPGWKPGRRIRVATKVDKAMVGPTSKSWSEFLPGLRERTCRVEVAEGADGFWQRLFHPLPPQDVDDPTMVAWDAVSSAAWYAFGEMEAVLFRSRYVLDRKVDPMPLYERSSKLLGMVSLGMVSPTLTELGEELMFMLCPSRMYVDELPDFMFFMENQFTPLKDSAAGDGWRLTTVQQTFVLPAVVTPEDPAGVRLTEAFLDQLRPRISGDPSMPAMLDPMRPALVDVLYLPADEFLLSASRGLEGYAVTVTFTGRDDEGWDTLQEKLRNLSEECHALGGRVHLVKNVEVDPLMLKEMYGDAFDRFLELKSKYDPRGLIVNEFFDRIFGC